MNTVSDIRTPTVIHTSINCTDTSRVRGPSTDVMDAAMKESSPFTPTLLDYARVIEMLWHPLAERGLVPPPLMSGPDLVYLQDALERASLGRVRDAMVDALSPPNDYDDYDLPEEGVWIEFAHGIQEQDA